ncbi:hypothetical protein Cme02nite_22040 [Catellatospora methionotrophica]|uniref:Uncharacterized protein n=1 Tax=Catellatospora methionotrophica TaxID=121620 RepID=A0A8J3L3H1_9ACTN|nr:hypothetical protein Cme02nite_22040 [Catellatospora methionotrophica]
MSGHSGRQVPGGLSVAAAPGVAHDRAAGGLIGSVSDLAVLGHQVPTRGPSVPPGGPVRVSAERSPGSAPWTAKRAARLSRTALFVTAQVRGAVSRSPT